MLELIVAIAVLSIFTAAAIPIARNAIKREREVELRRALREMRTAIDRYHRAFELGLISRLQQNAFDEGYPAKLEVLVEGVQASGSANRKLKFLRKIPVDPITGKTEWGFRAYQDEPNSQSWGGGNVYDVHSLSDAVALDGTKYKDW
ncbi:MAG: type II secretion system protein [Acidobacteria bacterium]|nr:type II secretion system protein [Acidobacteriota bacterium]